MAKRTRILITGSGGFIFGNFIRQIFHNYDKRKYTVSSIDRIRDSQLWNVYVNADHEFYIADIRDSHILHVIFEKEQPEVVIHGAGEFQGPDLHSSNITGTQNVINECLHSKARMIFVSSCRVYGDLCSDQKPISTENSALFPNDTFAATKITAERLVQNSGLKFNIVRLSDTYGPWQTSNNLIPHIISSILDNKDINIYGPGYQTRDWTHVFDTCSGLFSVIDNGTDGNIYNITSGHEFSNIEVAQIVCNTIGKGHELIKHVEKEVALRFSMSNDKLKELGWTPQFKFKDGIAQTCQWYLNNKYFLRM